MAVTPKLHVEQRAEGSDSPRYISGYAVVFEQDSKPFWDEWIERIDRNAFADTDMSDVRMVVDHGYSIQTLLARSHDGAGSLEITVDDIGVAFRFAVPNTSIGRDLVELIERGDVSECSFAFYVKEDRWTYAADDASAKYDVRTILKVDKLVDLSIVVSGQYGQTSVSVDERAAVAEMRAAAHPRRLSAELAGNIIDSIS